MGADRDNHSGGGTGQVKLRLSVFRWPPQGRCGCSHLVWNYGGAARNKIKQDASEEGLKSHTTIGFHEAVAENSRLRANLNQAGVHGQNVPCCDL